MCRSTYLDFILVFHRQNENVVVLLFLFSGQNFSSEVNKQNEQQVQAELKSGLQYSLCIIYKIVFIKFVFRRLVTVYKFVLPFCTQKEGISNRKYFKEQRHLAVENINLHVCAFVWKP